MSINIEVVADTTEQYSVELLAETHHAVLEQCPTFLPSWVACSVP